MVLDCIVIVEGTVNEFAVHSGRERGHDCWRDDGGYGAYYGFGAREQPLQL